MATGTCKVTITAAGIPGVAATLSPAYAGANSGRFDLPSGTLAAVAIEIPFGSVSSPTLVYVRNMSAQELEVTVNGVELTENLADGGVILQCSNGVPLVQPLESITLTTTDAVADADRYVEYVVLGDPAA